MHVNDNKSMLVKSATLWMGVYYSYGKSNVSWFPVFFGHRPKRFWNDRKKLSHFGQNVRKYRLKTLLWRVLIQLWHKWPKCFSEKKQAGLITCFWKPNWFPKKRKSMGSIVRLSWSKYTIETESKQLPPLIILAVKVWSAHLPLFFRTATLPPLPLL